MPIPDVRSKSDERKRRATWPNDVLELGSGLERKRFVCNMSLIYKDFVDVIFLKHFVDVIVHKPSRIFSFALLHFSLPNVLHYCTSAVDTTLLVILK